MIERKSAQVDFRRDQAIISTGHRSVDGFEFLRDPYFVVDGVDRMDEIAARVVDCLEASTHLERVRPASRESELPALVGVKGLSAYLKGVRAVDVVIQDGMMTVTPMSNGGMKTGLTWKSEEAILVESNVDLPAALIVAREAAD